MIKELKAKTLELRKNRDPLGKIMQYHIAEISKVGKNKNRETTEDEAVQYVKKTVQKLKEDSHDPNTSEIEVLEKLLPSMASEEEVRKFIESEGVDTLNKGAVMKAVRQQFGARVDMKMVGGMY